MLPLAPTTATGGHDTNVYFQPPSNVVLNYPCIVYSLDTMDSRKADNRGYLLNHVYKLTYIDTRPDGDMIDKIIQFPTARMTTSYTADGLYHYVYNISI